MIAGPQAGGRVRPVEMTAEPSFRPRVVRLAGVSVVALGLIWLLARPLGASPVVGAALLAGWVLMPLLLAASLRWPVLRYGLVVPSTLVSLGLLAIVIAWLPGNSLAAAGWLMITAGVLLGGMLGLWFWFRLAPVPAMFDHPFSWGRWLLVGIHIALIVGGLATVILGTLLSSDTTAPPSG